jgi:GntR family transcriptional regulator
VKLERLRLLGGKPLVYQRSYLPVRFAEMVRNYTPAISLYQQLHQHGGLAVTIAKEILKPIILQPEQARLLERETHDPALLSLRVSFYQDGTPVIYDEALLVANSFVIATERYGLRNSYQFHVLDSWSPDPLTLLMEND